MTNPDPTAGTAERCRQCGHPASHHDAGECWTNADGSETYDETSCRCSWYEPGDGPMTSPPDPTAGTVEQSPYAIWRTGRKVGRTIYRQTGEEPSDADQLIGVMDTAEWAALVVEAVNAVGDATR